MSLLLGVETSYSPYGIIIGKGQKVLFDSTTVEEFEESRDVAMMTQVGLEKVGATLQDISKIIVNVGPGGTSSVRTGVAFANSLAYSLKIPICSVNFFELICEAVWNTHQVPVVCTMKSTKNNLYAGLYEDGKLAATKYGFFEETLEKMIGDRPTFAVVGFHREKIVEHFSNKNKTVIDTELKLATSRFLIERSDEFVNRAISYPEIATPITDQSSIFYE